MDRCRPQTQVPLSSDPLKDWRECSIEDCIRCFLKEYDYLEDLHMIYRVRGPIVDLQLR